MSVEQRINLKFLVRLGKTPTEALQLLQEVYGDDTMSRTCLFEWHRKFKEGREEVEDDHRSGKPSTSRTDENVERVRQKVWSDRCLTVRMIADELGMNSERVWRVIVTNRQHLSVTPEELAGLHFLSTNVSKLNTKRLAYRYCKSIIYWFQPD